MQHHPNTVTPLPVTANRAEWLEQRRDGIGSSDASVIMGMSNWESPYSLWEQKTGRAPLDPPVDKTTEELREWGNRLEPVILTATAERLGVTITKPEQAWANTKRPWQRANLDGHVDGTETFCEFKTATAYQSHNWDGQIPDHAEIQVHHTGLVTGWRDAIVAGLIGGSHLSIHRITLNENILDMMQAAEEKFWHHVETDTEPDVDWHTRTRESLLTEWRQTRKTGVEEVDHDEAKKWVDQYQQAKQAEDEAKKLKAEAHNKLLKMLNGHDQIATGDTTWAKVRRGQIDKKRLEADHPNIYQSALVTREVLDTTLLKETHPGIYADYQNITLTI